LTYYLILDKVKPKVILEIGTAGGGTLFLFFEYCAWGSYINFSRSLSNYREKNFIQTY